MSLYAIIATGIAIIAPVIAYNQGWKRGIIDTYSFLFPNPCDLIKHLRTTDKLTPEDEDKLKDLITKLNKSPRGTVK